MPSFLDLLVVIGMFMLRFGVPMLVVAGLGYLLKRLDARWEAEARAYEAKQAAESAAVQPAAQKPAQRPVAPVRAPAPGPALPFVIPPAQKEQRIQPGMTAQMPAVPPGKAPEQRAQPGMMAQSAQHCWDVKGCSDASKAQCAAYKQPDKPCWQARFDAEGHIPEDCVSCDIFQRYPTM